MYTPFIFGDFSIITNVFINIHGYSNLINCMLKHLSKWMVSWHQFCTIFGTLEQ